MRVHHHAAHTIVLTPHVVEEKTKYITTWMAAVAEDGGNVDCEAVYIKDDQGRVKRFESADAALAAGKTFIDER